MKKIVLLISIITFLLYTFNFQLPASVKPYPKLKGAKESKLFSVKVNKQKIWTEHYTSNLEIDKLPDWFNAPYVREHQVMHIASFEGTGKLDFEITLPEKPGKVVVKPVSKGITPKITGNKIDNYDFFAVYPAKHFVVPEEEIKEALEEIEEVFA